MVAELWCEDGVVETVKIPEQVPTHIDAKLRFTQDGRYVAPDLTMRFYAYCVWRRPDGSQVAVYATRRYAAP